jgi:hypothetical protein
MSELCDCCHDEKVAKDDPGFKLCNTCKARIQLSDMRRMPKTLEALEEDAQAELAKLTALAMARLTDNQREELFRDYCPWCGTKQPWHPDRQEPGRSACQCWNDE